MFASSQVDKGKVGRLAAAIQLAFKDLGIFPTPSSKTLVSPEGAPPDALPSMTNLLDARNISDLAKLQKELAQALEGEIKRKEVALRVGREGLVVSLREVGFFDSGSAEVRLKSEPSVARIAKVLEAGPFYVRIEGHTDNVPIHTSRFQSNWELSTARATEMIKLFIARYEFPPENLSAAGFGEFHPVATNGTAEGRALNRRVDIVVVAAPRKAPSRPWSDAGISNLSSPVIKEQVPER
jgi:chemotaxis protein MotB